MSEKIKIESYEGREQAFIKHYLLEKYLPELAYKVGSKWDNLMYVDGFAGPWEVKQADCGDSSFGVALKALSDAAITLHKRQVSLNVHSFLVERNKKVFPILHTFAMSKSRQSFKVDALNGRFINQLGEIDRTIAKYGEKTFKFILLDPKGWKDIPLLPLQSFLKNRSCEVLINVMTRHIIRFVNQDDRADSYHQLFGRKDVLPLIKATKPIDRPDIAVREYCKSLRQICGFKYVSSAIIFEPGQEAVRYFLVYATNSPKGIEVFKAAENKASRVQDELRHENKKAKTGQSEFSFDSGPPKSRIVETRWKKYSDRARAKMIQLLLNNSGPLPYTTLYCETMAFPLVTPRDLESWLATLEPAVSIKLENSDSRRKPHPDKDDQIIVNDADYLKKELNKIQT